jgi:lipopolysaccharide export system protein LptA
MSSFFSRSAAAAAIFLLSLCAARAAGAAQITLGDYTLWADEIKIDDSSDTITAAGSAGVKGRDGQMTARTMTITTDPEWKGVVSAGASGNVKFEFVTALEGREGKKLERRLSGTCAGADWNRDPEWKGDASEDKGIVSLKGSVRVKVRSEGTDKRSGEIACETMTLYLNQGRYVAKGGLQQRAELTLEFGERSGKADVDSD